MSIEIVACEICKHPRVVAINEDLIKRYDYRKICKRNGLKYSPKMVKDLSIHHAQHIVSPSQAMAKHMIYEEAIQLKNSAVEVNNALDQIDLLMTHLYDALESMDASETDGHYKLVRNITDLMKRKSEYLNMLTKMTGKTLEGDLKRASLTEVIKQVSKEVGEQKVRQIKNGQLKTTALETFLLNDPYVNKLLQELEHGVEIDNADKNIKS